MVGINAYSGKPFNNLSVTPINDVRAMAHWLKKADYATENIFENIESASKFEDLVKSYINRLNKEDVEIGWPITSIHQKSCGFIHFFSRRCSVLLRGQSGRGASKDLKAKRGVGNFQITSWIELWDRLSCLGWISIPRGKSSVLFFLSRSEGEEEITGA